MAADAFVRVPGVSGGGRGGSLDLKLGNSSLRSCIALLLRVRLCLGVGLLALVRLIASVDSVFALKTDELLQ